MAGKRIPDLPELNAIPANDDYFEVYDSSADLHKRVRYDTVFSSVNASIFSIQNELQNIALLLYDHDIVSIDNAVGNLQIAVTNLTNQLNLIDSGFEARVLNTFTSPVDAEFANGYNDGLQGESIDDASLYRNLGHLYGLLRAIYNNSTNMLQVPKREHAPNYNIAESRAWLNVFLQIQPDRITSVDTFNADPWRINRTPSYGILNNDDYTHRSGEIKVVKWRLEGRIKYIYASPSMGSVNVYFSDPYFLTFHDSWFNPSDFSLTAENIFVVEGIWSNHVARINVRLLNPSNVWVEKTIYTTIYHYSGFNLALGAEIYAGGSNVSTNEYVQLDYLSIDVIR